MSASGASAPQRRRLHVVAGVCALGAGVGIAQYLAHQPRPPAGEPLTIDVSGLVPGKLLSVEWQAKTVWVLRRSVAEVAALAEREHELLDPASIHSLQPEACRNRHRSLRPEYFVAIGQCTHQGCPPQLRTGLGAHGEFLCPCHTSKYDLAGRVFRAGPALANLVIPAYRFDNERQLVVGVL